MIACDCPTCTSDDPRDRRTRTGAAVQWVDPNGEPRTVLIDCGPDIRQQAIREGLWRCDAILFTHNHVDHIFGLDEVRRFNAVMKAPLNIYAEDYVLESLRRVYRHIFDRDANTNDSFVATLIPNRIVPPAAEGGTPAALELWGLRFEPIRLLHGRLPILGWRIEEIATPHAGQEDGSPLPLAYCTDVSAIPTGAWRRLTGLRTLALDGLRFRRHPTHFSLDQAVDASLQIAADQTYFIHIAHEIRHAEVDPSLPEGIHLAYDGLALGDGDAELFREHGRLNSHLRPAPIADQQVGVEQAQARFDED